MRQYVRFGWLSLALAISAATAHAAIYKWVEDNGTVTFRDTPPPGKPATIVDVEAMSPGMSQPSTGTGNGDARAAAGANAPVGIKPEKGAEAGNRSAKPKDFPRVELYVTSWCGYCKQAKAFLASQGVPFKEYNIERDADAARQMKRLNARGGVPFAVIGDKNLVGFSQAAYQHALGLD